MSKLNITVIHRCGCYALVPAGATEQENAKIENKAKTTYCPACQEALDKPGNKDAKKASLA
jgi:hypothetical protein